MSREKSEILIDPNVQARNAFRQTLSSGVGVLGAGSVGVASGRVRNKILTGKILNGDPVKHLTSIGKDKAIAAISKAGVARKIGQFGYVGAVAAGITMGVNAIRTAKLREKADDYNNSTNGWEDYIGN